MGNTAIKKDYSLRFLNFFNKVSTVFGVSLSKEFWNYSDYLLGVRFTKKKKIITIGNIRKNILSLIKLIFFLKITLNWGGKALFIDVDSETVDVVKERNNSLCQYFIKRPLNMGGGLTNFNNMRWYYLKNTLYFFPKVKPSFLILLNYIPAYDSVINEAYQLSIPIIGSVNFNTNFLENKIAYNIYTPLDNTSRSYFKLFFIEIFKYSIKLFSSFNYILKTGLLVKASYKNLLRYLKKTFNVNDIFKQRRKLKIISIINKKEKMSSKNKKKKKQNNKKIKIKLIKSWRLRRKFIYINNKGALGKIFKRFWSKLLIKKYIDKKYNKRKFYDFFKRKKRKWFKKKKFKQLGLYTKNFIFKGKFKGQFKHIKRRNMMLKKLFCNLFDLQYNFKTWWRETKKKGLYTKLKYFSKNFKSSREFLNYSERFFVFLVKKIFFLYNPQSVFDNIKKGFFLCNNQEIRSPTYVVKNNSIIQEKLFYTKIWDIVNLMDDENYLYDFWDQWFFRFLYYLDKGFMTFGEGVPHLHPTLEKKKTREGTVKFWFHWHHNFWKRYILCTIFLQRRKLIKDTHHLVFIRKFD